VTTCVALLGGSFDPVHHGHVALAELFARLLRPDELRMLPAGQPWQKAACRPATPTAWRCWNWRFARRRPVTIDTREIARATRPTRSRPCANCAPNSDPDASIVFLMGADQLQKLDTWRDWRLVRTGQFRRRRAPRLPARRAALPPAVAKELAPRLATPEEVRASPAGLVCLAHTLAVDISATRCAHY
jgi:nicotinate-nucleotide adenylyltransferase